MRSIFKRNEIAEAPPSSAPVWRWIQFLQSGMLREAAGIQTPLNEDGVLLFPHYRVTLSYSTIMQQSPSCELEGAGGVMGCGRKEPSQAFLVNSLNY